MGLAAEGRGEKLKVKGGKVAAQNRAWSNELRAWSRRDEKTERPKDEKIKGGKVKGGKVRKIND